MNFDSDETKAFVIAVSSHGIIYIIIRLNHVIRGKSRDVCQANCVSRDTW